MNREHSLAAALNRAQPFDIIVIGGGATGAGVAVDAASRGLSVLLLERGDFGCGTSSRSTKIIHGGIRYLAQGRLGLVREALRERAYLINNAPHLVKTLPFVVPIENAFQRAKYHAGLKLYDFLAGGQNLRPSRWLSQRELITKVQGIDFNAFKGGMRYYDAQFDDARLLVSLVETAEQLGASTLNYAEVIALHHDTLGRIRAVTFRDAGSESEHEVKAHCVVNATGVASDALLSLDDARHESGLMPSQGSHVVVHRDFLVGDNAVLMPRTPDKRVMFAVPWLGHVLLGTTDIPIDGDLNNPVARADEIDMILDVARRYLARKPTRADILSVFAGIRPLVQAPGSSNTAALSREHSIDVRDSGLVSVSGGKWTTYRLMAEQCVDAAANRHQWSLEKSQTHVLKLASHPDAGERRSQFLPYGKHAATLSEMIATTPVLGNPLVDSLPYTEAECVWAIRQEMALNVDDILSRRTRALFLNARAALDAAPRVLQILTAERGLDAASAARQLLEFQAIAQNYIV